MIVVSELRFSSVTGAHYASVNAEEAGVPPPGAGLALGMSMEVWGAYERRHV